MPRRLQRRRGVKGWKKPEGAIIVDRTSRWGNPFTVEEYGRPEAVRLHRVHLYAGTLTNKFGRLVTVQDVRRELPGYDLICYCGPDELCHADTLLAIAAGDNLEDLT